MIKQIIIFNKNGEIYLRKKYNNYYLNSDSNNNYDSNSNSNFNDDYYLHFKELAKSKDSFMTFNGSKLIINKYLDYFILFITEYYENEFYILDIISKFVNILDKYFQQGDISFRYDEVLTILDEMILDGKVYELNEQLIFLKTKAIYK
ncbi:AP-3 complex subunit sigma-1 [Dictyocoela muelleri]|nr:AP-3 complex subunit sigma-1 [Dictyocoela muelleri]